MRVDSPTAYPMPRRTFTPPAPRPSRPAGDPFADQVALFLEQYPRGFRDPRWLADQRGQGATKRLKRHRDPALRDAQDLLARVDADPLELTAALSEVLSKTTLVGSRHVKRLQQLPADRARRLGKGLQHLLRTGSLVGYVRALAEAGVPASWPLVSAPLALAWPQAEVYVKPKLLARQAKRIGRSVDPGAARTDLDYVVFRGLLAEVRKRCEAAGLEPQDGFDVVDFVWTTLRPMAQATLAGAHQRRQARRRTEEAA